MTTRFNAFDAPQLWTPTSLILTLTRPCSFVTCVTCKPCFTFTPRLNRPHPTFTRHAAASYDHRPIVTYLISKGGNINITDEDGDTPLYTVESVECARFLIEQCGADPAWKNHEGVTVSHSDLLTCPSGLQHAIQGEGT